MPKIKLLFSILILLSLFGTIQAACGNNCTCGCQQGNPCTCSTKCGGSCSCGCQQGGPCLCAPKCAGGCECGCGTGLRCDCGPSCHCGCGEDPEPEGYNYESPIPVPLRAKDAHLAAAAGYGGVWLPEDPVLFKQFVADPRAVIYSAGWRFRDRAIDKNVIDVSYGDSLALYRWFNVWPWCGDLQFEIEGALWAVFEPLRESAPLVNADYYVGFPLTYAIDRWQFRLRGFHISSHIGDEFLLDHPRFHRKNPSAEYLDFFISHDLTNEVRVYGGLGYIVHDDESFKEKRFYQAIGTEVHAHSLGFSWYNQQLYGQPFLGMHLRHNARFRHHIDMTYVLGYEFGKMSGLQRMARVYVEYHDGYSVEGQFARLPTHYLSVRFAYAW